MKPRINDITTNPDKPVQFDALSSIDANKDRDMSYPQKFKKIQLKAYPDVKPLKSQVASEKLLKLSKETLEEMKIKIEKIDSAKNRIEAIAVTSLLKFRDDIVVEIRSENSSEKDNENEVHMRSKSRLGLGDLGANAKRIEEFMKRLKSKI